MSGDREHRVARASSHKRLARSPSLEMLARNDGPPTSAQRTLSSLSVASVSRTRLESPGRWCIERLTSSDSDCERSSTLSADMWTDDEPSERSGSGSSVMLFGESVRLERFGCSLSTDSEGSTKGGSLVAPLNHVKRPRTDEELLLSEIIAGAVKEAAWRRRLLKEARIEVMEDVLQFCAARMTTACVVFSGE